MVSRQRHNLTSGFIDTVIRESRQVLEKTETERPADAALYALGEAYVHHAYEDKDYGMSRYYFEKLIANFPDSPLTDEARTFVSLFETFDVKEEKIQSLKKKKEKHESIIIAHKEIENGDFAAAVRENLLILEQPDDEAPKDGALYNLGMIYAHFDNPAKDYQKSRKYFGELIGKYPDSPLAGEARTWLGLFEIFERMQQIDIDIEQKKKELTR